MLTHIARDCQTNETHHLFTKHPRKELLEKLDRKHASPMYIDKLNGEPVCIGWIIAERWLEVYSVKRIGD